MNFADFFKQATQFETSPYDYQRRLAEEAWPDVLEIPTGMGKTVAVILAWAYKRRELHDPGTPRRLVYCLPMRVLVEQTARNAEQWLCNLGFLGELGDKKVSINLLMGGESDIKSWVEYPDEDMIILGTQDMLLSRALMRGYGISRYRWPMDFALLHNDALWVYDEIQLMGPALSTSTQLDAFRRDVENKPARPSRSLWASATLRTDWLNSIDFCPFLAGLTTLQLDENEKQSAAVQKRWCAAKHLNQANTVLNAQNAKKNATAYIEALANEISEHHKEGTQTLVIVNRVDRAQQLYIALGKKLKAVPRLLLHARFRPAERGKIEAALREQIGDEGRIIVATQAIEAGVDISSRILFAELAPWSSLVQRFGRCNRSGEHKTADIFWVDITDNANESAPYPSESLATAREVISELSSARAADLPGIEEALVPSQILRRKDFTELFNTDADLSGFDVDISPYIRDIGTPQLQLFWRAANEDKTNEYRPAREELCPAGIAQAKAHLGSNKKARSWDGLSRQWIEIRADRVRPGMTIMLDAAEGGYDEELGFTPKSKKTVQPIGAEQQSKEADVYDADSLVTIGRWVSLSEHLLDVAAAAEKICESVAVEKDIAEAVITAGRWHDVGKAHPAFQQALKTSDTNRNPPDENTLWAKSAGKGRLKYESLAEDKPQARPYFRHELASALAWLEHRSEHPHSDLIAYLIAAHHGKVRMGLRALPNENQPDDDRLFARGVWHGDLLPPVCINGEEIPETSLKLNLMRLGESTEQGPSWTARTHGLLTQYGPFQLAWFETLVRLSDWRASATEAENE